MCHSVRGEGLIIDMLPMHDAWRASPLVSFGNGFSERRTTAASLWTAAARMPRVGMQFAHWLHAPPDVLAAVAAGSACTIPTRNSMISHQLSADAIASDRTVTGLLDQSSWMLSTTLGGR